MSDPKNLQSYIDRYRVGEVTESEFKNRLATDSDLRAEFELYQKDLLVIRSAIKAQLRDKAASALQQHEEKSKKVWRWKQGLLLLGTLILLILAYLFFQKMQSPLSTQKIYAAYFELPAPAGERSGTAQSDIWNEAMLAYSNHDFDKTLELMTPLVDAADFLYPDRGRLYVGLSHLMTNEPQQAVVYFDAISSESSYVQDAEWYRALSFLKMGDLTDAKKNIQKIMEQPRHFKHQEAIEMMEQINQM